jgi:PTH2 family peptidyl-tRNA hydrolase
MGRIKQVILVRKDLKMRRGKEIAQGSHASMQFLVDQILRQENKAVSELTLSLSDIELTWLNKGMAKVCLRVNSEAELLQYHEKAKTAGLASFLIRDSGRTEFGGQPTYTSCAIGPAEVEKIDVITGDLVPY